MKVFITGATGLIGRHLVERLVQDKHSVTALVRPSSKVEHLQNLGVNLCYGDITHSRDFFTTHLKGMEWVFHAAAHVSEWADRNEMIRANVGPLETLARSTDPKSLRRFVFLGSMSVLGMQKQENVDENAPCILTGDNYNYTKVMAERLAVRLAREEGIPITVIRPPYVYGPYDSQIFPRMIQSLRNGLFKYIGDGDQPFTLIYVKNLVDALILAAMNEKAKPGEIYMVTDGEPITRRELVETLCEELGIEKPRSKVPVWLAYAVCPVFEGLSKLTKNNKIPLVNKSRIKFMHSHLTFNIEKARMELGYNPGYGVHEAVRSSARWFSEHWLEKERIGHSEPG